MDEQAKDFWAKAGRSVLPEGWPTDESGQAEQAVYLTLQSELGGIADVTISMLEGCGIPAFKLGTQGKVILGFAGLGVDLYVPHSRLEEAKALLEIGEVSADSESAE